MAATPRNLLFETTDHDQAGEHLTGIYGGSIRLGGRKNGVFRLTRLVTDTFAVSTATHVAEIGYTLESLPMLMIARPRTAVVDYRCGSAERRFGPGEVHLSNTAADHPPIQAGWDNGAVQAVTLPFATLEQVADAARTRRPEPVRFTDLCAVGPGPEYQLAATIDFLTASLGEYPEAMNEPLVVGAAGKLLAAAVLNTFPNTAVIEPGIEDRHDAHPRTLRRAITFIDDHAHLDICVADIAAAVHVTIRTLQYAFRRHLGITPMGYLRRVRLHHAHQELMATDPTSGSTVTQIAARWGFFHPGRFATYYRTTYGRPPYRTLVYQSSVDA
ncbi:helix-turn-helix transcriptional regulator [Amycolatopsis sp. NPDC059027]|uniref:helix-turn-helix transcriptional regulator n=1 Tax=Amycolatopsis sp. NPDC059027 TaxID=3346709 RepID=UPI003672373D